jgi:hypothetical protein
MGPSNAVGKETIAVRPQGVSEQAGKRTRRAPFTGVAEWWLPLKRMTARLQYSAEKFAH